MNVKMRVLLMEERKIISTGKRTTPQNEGRGFD
jgi:hypothetical protein